MTVGLLSVHPDLTQTQISGVLNDITRIQTCRHMCPLTISCQPSDGKTKEQYVIICQIDSITETVSLDHDSFTIVLSGHGLLICTLSPIRIVQGKAKEVSRYASFQG